jgi:hypothetical protein
VILVINTSEVAGITDVPHCAQPVLFSPSNDCYLDAPDFFVCVSSFRLFPLACHHHETHTPHLHTPHTPCYCTSARSADGPQRQSREQRLQPAGSPALTIVPLGAGAPLAPHAVVVLGPGLHPGAVGHPGLQGAGRQAEDGVHVSHIMNFELVEKETLGACSGGQAATLR